MSPPNSSALSPEVLVIGATLALLAFLFLFRSLWLRLLGPVFVYEADRGARRGRTFIVRVAYVFVLLGVIYLTYPRVEVMRIRGTNFSDEGFGRGMFFDEEEYATAPKVMSEFAAKFSYYFVIAQAVIVLLLTPIYVGGAISDEKENRSLDFLLATQMSRAEILLGKLGARLLNVFGVLLVALPVLAIVQVWGGADLPRVVAGMAATAFTALSVGGISLMCSVLSRRTFAAIFASYILTVFLGAIGLATPVDFLSNPISFLIELNENINGLQDNAQFLDITAAMLAEYAGVHISVAIICFLIALWQLRRRASNGLFSWVGRVTMKVGRKQTTAGMEAIRKPLRVYAPLPPVGDLPLLWKERYVGRTVFAKTFQDLGWIVFVLFGLFMPVVAYLAYIREETNPIPLVMAGLMLRLSMAAGVCLVFGVGLRLAGSVSREREQQTLENLLTIPLSRRELLAAKWMGGVMRNRRFLFATVGTVFATCLMAELPAIVWILLPATILLHTIFAANLGLFFSVVCRSTTRAYVCFALVFLVLTAGTWMVEELDYHVSGSGTLGIDAINPIQSWWKLVKPPQRISYQSYPTREYARPESESFPETPEVRMVIRFLASLLFYGSASALLWQAARNRFIREKGRTQRFRSIREPVGLPLYPK